MNMTRICAWVSLAAALTAGGQAIAQQPVRVAADGGGEARCRKDVKEYLDTMNFLRQNAGNQISDKVAVGFVSEARLQQVASSQGACAAAQLLREKGAPR